VAVRWSNAEVKDLGHDTNAAPLLIPDTKKRRTFGAKWEVTGTKGAHTATWSTKVPPGATHVEVVLVYTDIALNTPANTATIGQGDAPVVIGSFTGDLGAGGWTIAFNQADWTAPYTPAKKYWNSRHYPWQPDYPGMLASARKVLMEKTGYELQARPAGLTTTSTDAAKLKAKSVIQAAFDKGLINSLLDTGYDIVPR
jgi:hypothetical protein